LTGSAGNVSHFIDHIEGAAEVMDIACPNGVMFYQQFYLLFYILFFVGQHQVGLYPRQHIQFNRFSAAYALLGSVPALRVNAKFGDAGHAFIEA
jgi:hypothetical protein